MTDNKPRNIDKIVIAEEPSDAKSEHNDPTIGLIKLKETEDIANKSVNDDTINRYLTRELNGITVFYERLKFG